MASLRLKETVGDHELRIRGENGRMGEWILIERPDNIKNRP